MLNKIFSTLKLIQEKTNTTTALVTATLPIDLIGFGFISIAQGNMSPLGICLLNNAKLIGLSFGSEYLNNKFKISDIITEKLGEGYGKFTELGMSAVADIAVNFTIYGIPQVTATLLNTVSLTGLDLFKLSIADAIDHGYVDYSEIYSVDQQSQDL